MAGVFRFTMPPAARQFLAFSLASSSRVRLPAASERPCRLLHSSPALDPTDHKPQVEDDVLTSLMAQNLESCGEDAGEGELKGELKSPAGVGEGERQRVREEPVFVSLLDDLGAGPLMIFLPFDLLLSAMPINSPHVHVKLSYLHRMTKPKPEGVEVGPKDRIRPPAQVVPLSRDVFGRTPRKDVLHANVVYYLDSLRSGTASTKTRSDVAGSGRKIRPQKGTGQARLGTRQNPLLRGGGVIHGPHPRDFATQLPRRLRELGLRSALGLRWRAGDLVVVPSLDFEAPPSVTGKLWRLLRAKGWDDALFLTAPRAPSPVRPADPDSRPSAADPFYTPEQRAEHAAQIRNFVLASANIPRVELIELAELANKQPKRKTPGELHAYEILARRKLVCDLGAIEWLEEKLGGAIFHEDPSVKESPRELMASMQESVTETQPQPAE